VRWPFGLFAPRTPSAARAEGRGGEGVRRPVREWAALPPIQRAAGDLEPTAQARQFAAGLPGAVGVPLALRPLGHARGADAPAGLVAGLPVPPAAYAGREPMVLAQRRPAERARLSWPEWGAAAEEAPEPAVEPEPAFEDVAEAPGAAPAPPPPVPAPRPVAQPVREPGHVAAAAAEAAPAVAPEALPVAVEPRPVRAVPVEAAPPSLTVSRFSPPPVSLDVRPAAAPPRQSAAAAAAEPAMAMPDAEPSRRLNVGQSRRMGLGAPLSTPVVPAVQRSVETFPTAAAPEAPPASEPAPAPSEAVLEPPSAAAPPELAAVAEPEPTVGADLPVQPLLDAPVVRARRASAPDAAPGMPAPEPAPAAQAVTGVPPSPPGDLGRPIYRVQRRPAAGTPAPAGDAGPAMSPMTVGPVTPPTAPVVHAVQRIDAEPLGALDLPLAPATAPPPSAVEAEPDVPTPPPTIASAGPPPAPAWPEPLAAPDAPLPVVADVASAAPAAPAGPPQQARPASSGPAPAGPVGPAAAASAPVPALVVSRRVAVPAGTPAAASAAPARAEAAITLPLVGSRPLALASEAAPAPPAEPLVVARSLEAAPAAPAPLLVAPVARDEPALSLPMAMPLAVAPAAATATAAAMGPTTAPVWPVVQASREPVGTGESPLAAPVVAQMPEAVVAQPMPAEIVPAFAAPADVPVQRADDGAAPASGGPGGAGGHSDKELDDLARQLYDRLRSRLRMELLVDRERAGLITDLR